MEKSRTAGVETGDHDGLRVLLVEDNRVNRMLASKMLIRLGCDATVAENGESALALLESSSFDLVFMDVQMPVMDGLTAAARIRADRRLDTLPVIAMTAHAMTGDRERCLDAGMDDYFTKPVKVEEIKAMLEKWRDGRVAPATEACAVAPTPPFATDGSAPSAQSVRPIAIERALANLDGDGELLEEAVQVFLETLPTLLATLNDAIQSGHAAAIAAAAHSIRGAAANIGAESVSEAARQLEQRETMGEVADAATEFVALTGELDALIRFAQDRFASCKTNIVGSG